MTWLQELFLKMYLIRRTEEVVAREYPRQQMRCPVHLSVGQEAVAVGACEFLNKNDFMVGTHRAHAWYLAKGGSLEAFFGELLGKVTGCGRGQAGSMHMIDRSCGFMGATSIVAGTIPVGVGLAFAKKIKNEPGVSVVTFGDAAIEEGVFHESANFASLHKLPVIFACENNLYSCYTHIRDRQPKRTSMFHVAQCHEMQYMQLDGNNVEGVAKNFKAAIELAKSGPVFVEMMTYRHLEHCGPNNDDHLNYREEMERKEWLDRDPLFLAEKKLGMDFTDAMKLKMKAIGYEIEKALKVAQDAPFPEQSELGKFLWA